MFHWLQESEPAITDSSYRYSLTETLNQKTWLEGGVEKKRPVVVSRRKEVHV